MLRRLPSPIPAGALNCAAFPLRQTIHHHKNPIPMFQSITPLRRMLFSLLVLLALAPVPAFSLSVMDPFNLPASMDAGTDKLGDGIA